MTIKNKILLAGAVTFIVFMGIGILNISTHKQILANLQIRDRVNERLAAIETFGLWKNEVIRLVSDIVAYGHVPPYTGKVLDPP